MLPNPSDDLAVSGLLREIDGIPFLASGFEACVAFHKDALRENPAARHSEFRWDPGIREIVPN
jgi:hypothetical protein